MTHQLESWDGEFGTAYADRNLVDWLVRLPAFRQVLEARPFQLLLKAGSTCGQRLLAQADLQPEAEIGGLEPNRHALQIVLALGSGFAALQGPARGGMP